MAQKMYSVEVPGTARPDLGLGGIRRNALRKPPSLSVDGCSTVFEVFQKSALAFPNNRCLGHRVIGKDGEAGPYQWITYKQTYDRALNFGAGLRNLEVCPPNERDGLVALGFYAKNCPEFVVGDMGCYSQSIVPVPLYDTLGADSVEYCVRQTEMKAILCSVEVFNNVVDVASKGLLTTAILMDGHKISAEELASLKEKGEEVGCRVFSMLEVEANGEESPVPPALPSGNDVAFFCYTSGTTGDPKGAEVRHSGIISCIQGLRDYGVDTYETDVHLSYLPLPHVFERGVMLSILYGAGAVGFYQGDTLKIMEDLQELRPTVFPSVPRLLNRVHDKLLAGVTEAGGLKKFLFDKALAAKIAGLKENKYKHAIWDRLVFNAVKAKIGFDRVRLLFTGSAPIAGHVLNFLRAVMGCPVIEGYGQTESSMAISFTEQFDCSIGHVGLPSPCNEIRLVDVPDMGYRSIDTEHNDGSKCLGRGEIWFRGPNVFKGYYAMEEKTAETIQDGWCLTGDIGMWTPDGKLRIIDRKKNIFKLAQGEYVAAEKIENVITRSPLILQTFVYGDSLQNSLVAIVVPDPEQLEAQKMDVASPETRAAVFKSLVGECKRAELKGFEIPKAIYIEDTAFDMDKPATGDFPARTRLLTPTFKLQRPKAKDFYKDETQIIDKLYEEINSVAKL